ncbi:hypothetical protein D3C76_89680 [compost metagenome]
MSDEAIKAWLELQPTSVRKSVTFLPAEEAGPMYHLSLDGEIKKFTPFVTRRAADKENISVPRISVAPSIMGCFTGYMSSWNDIAWPDLKNKKFKNGWYLYRLPYEYCIKPDKKQLFDQENSNEHWLVTYSPETREYKGDIVAKMFYAELKMQVQSGKYPDYLVKLVVEVLEGPVLFGGTTALEKGTYLIEGPAPENHADWSDIKPYTINKISYGEYAKLKGLSADMLSYHQPAAYLW